MQTNQPAPASNNTLKIILTIVIALVVVCVMIPCCVIVVLTLMGPQIANVFSSVTRGLTP
jgi:hypothetical protein